MNILMLAGALPQQEGFLSHTIYGDFCAVTLFAAGVLLFWMALRLLSKAPKLHSLQLSRRP